MRFSALGCVLLLVLIRCVETPESCPTGHWELRAIHSMVQSGENCFDQTHQTPIYDYKGNFTGNRTETKRTCVPTYAQGPVTGHKNVWVCPGKTPPGEGGAPYVDPEITESECLKQRGQRISVQMEPYCVKDPCDRGMGCAIYWNCEDLLTKGVMRSGNWCTRRIKVGSDPHDPAKKRDVTVHPKNILTSEGCAKGGGFPDYLNFWAGAEAVCIDKGSDCLDGKSCKDPWICSNDLYLHSNPRTHHRCYRRLTK